MAESAISLGVTGTCGLLAVVSPAPVTAHDKITFLFIVVTSQWFFWYMLEYFSTFKQMIYSSDPVIIFHPLIELLKQFIHSRLIFRCQRFILFQFINFLHETLFKMAAPRNRPLPCRSE